MVQYRIQSITMMKNVRMCETRVAAYAADLNSLR